MMDGDGTRSRMVTMDWSEGVDTSPTRAESQSRHHLSRDWRSEVDKLKLEIPWHRRAQTQIIATVFGKQQHHHDGGDDDGQPPQSSRSIRPTERR
jgi:hypothetical protein